jgi:hypothetical protein
MFAHLVQPVSEGIVSTRSSSDDAPVVDDKLVTTRSSLSLRNLLKGSNELNRRLEGQGERAIGLGDAARKDGLEIAGTIAQDDEDNVLLLPQAMYPTENADALSPVLTKVKDLGLEKYLDQYNSR